MRTFGLALILLCLLMLVGLHAASAQDVLGPFCLQALEPVNATFELLVPVVTPERFQIVGTMGTVSGNVPVNGAGLLNNPTQSRFLITAGATSEGGSGAPISITGTMDLNTGTGSGFCFGGGDCGSGKSVALQLCPP